MGPDVEPFPGGEAGGLPSPTRALASLVGWLTVAIFALGILGGPPKLRGSRTAVGLIVYVALRVLRGILDPLLVWLLTRNAE